MNTHLKPCPVCKSPVNGEPSCPDCGATLVPFPTYEPPPSPLDDTKPIPGLLHATYDTFIGKRVKIKQGGATGKVFGVDPCPMVHPGSIHPEHVETGYLHIQLDNPPGPETRTFALPEAVEVLT